MERPRHTLYYPGPKPTIVAEVGPHVTFFRPLGLLLSNQARLVSLILMVV